MAAKVTNNTYGTLSASISDSATTLTLNSGEGARFPALGAGDYFYATLVDTSNNLEIIKVTARSVDSMTIVRGQDGTTARAYGLNDRLELRPVAALFNEKADVSTVEAQLADKLDYVAPGASGNVLTSTGSGWESQALDIGAIGSSVVVFESSGTWSAPSGITRALVMCVGGGGGAGGSLGIYVGGIGGNGGFALVAVTGLSGSVSITVGSAGNGAYRASGAAGTTSSFGSYVTCGGGGGGAVAINASGAVGANGTVTVSSGTTVRSGGAASGYLYTSGNTTTNQTAVSFSVTGAYAAGHGGDKGGSYSTYGRGGTGGVVVIAY